MDVIPITLKILNLVLARASWTSLALFDASTVADSLVLENTISRTVP